MAILVSTVDEQTASDKVENSNKYEELRSELASINKRLQYMDQAYSLVALNQMAYCNDIEEGIKEIIRKHEQEEEERNVETRRNLGYTVLAFSVSFIFQGASIISPQDQINLLLGGMVFFVIAEFLLMSTFFHDSSKRRRNKGQKTRSNISSKES